MFLGGYHLIDISPLKQCVMVAPIAHYCSSDSVATRMIKCVAQMRVCNLRETKIEVDITFFFKNMSHVTQAKQ